MKRFVIVVTCILLCFIFVFTCIGYAAISDTLQITGNATATPPETLFISSVSQSGGTATLVSSSYSELFLQNSIDFSGGDSVTLDVVIVNNTAQDTVYYEGYKIGSGNYNNSDINVKINSVVTSGGVDLAAGNTQFPSKSTCTVNVTLTKSNANAGNQLTSGITFMFMDSARAEEVMQNPGERFEQILNNPDKMDELIGILKPDENLGWGEEDHNGTFIGDVPGAPQEDKDQILSLLGLNNEMLTYNGVEVFFIIKFENIDGDVNTGITNENAKDGPTPGCEMVLYFTTDTEEKIAEGTYDWLGRAESVDLDVCAAVFMYDSNSSSWTQLDSGDSDGLFQGTAKSTGYYGHSDSIIDRKHNSFDTGTWISSKEYYGVSSGKITEIVKKALSQ